MYANREIIIFGLDEVIAAVLRNEIYSKTGRRRLESLFPLYFTWSERGFGLLARKEPVLSAFCAARSPVTIFLRHLFGSVLVYEK
jgi:hypothetical protein